MNITIHPNLAHGTDSDPITPEDQDRIRCATFGLLVRLSTPVVKSYHSDLYRDAQYVQSDDFVQSFHEDHVYVARTCGTHLFPASEETGNVRFDDDEVHVYDITVRPYGRYSVVITATEREEVQK